VLLIYAGLPVLYHLTSLTLFSGTISIIFRTFLYFRLYMLSWTIFDIMLLCCLLSSLSVPCSLLLFGCCNVLSHWSFKISSLFSISSMWMTLIFGVFFFIYIWACVCVHHKNNNHPVIAILGLAPLCWFIDWYFGTLCSLYFVLLLIFHWLLLVACICDLFFSLIF